MVLTLINELSCCSVIIHTLPRSPYIYIYIKNILLHYFYPSNFNYTFLYLFHFFKWIKLIMHLLSWISIKKFYPSIWNRHALKWFIIWLAKSIVVWHERKWINTFLHYFFDHLFNLLFNSYSYIVDKSKGKRVELASFLSNLQHKPSL